jgi:DNA-binding NarL/FixJ family response regulator
MDRIRVLVVDDHPALRAGILSILGSARDIQVVGEASTGPQALALARELAPDVLVLDAGLPELTGVEVAQQLKSEDSPVRVLMLSAHEDREYALGSLKAGVAGYLVKAEASDLILTAIRGVARGETGWLSRSIASHLVHWTSQDVESEDLTDRELQVLRLIVAGETNQAIANALNIAAKTVEKHTAAIYRKLDVSSRTEAAVQATLKKLV